MNILTKGMLLIAVPVAFQLVFLAVLLKAQKDAGDADWLAAHSKQVIAQAAVVEEPVLKELGEMRRAVILGDASSRGTASFWADVDGRTKALIDLVSDNKDQMARARTIQDEVGVFHAWVADLTKRIASGSRVRAEERIRDGSGKAIVDKMLSTMGEFLREEARLDRERTATALQARQDQRWMMVFAAVGSVIAGTIAAILFARSVGKRLAVLTANARCLADGTALAAPVMGSDEIAALDEVLHETGARLAAADASQKQLQAELHKRAEELAAVNETLRQQTQENEMFIYSVSHDLRSPLVNLQGFGKELRHACDNLGTVVEGVAVSEGDKKRLRDILELDIRDSLKYLQTAVTRAANIIDALLRLSRAGRVEYQKKRVDVAEVALRVVDAMQGTIRERGATVSIGGLAPAMGDAAAVEQIFGNLVGNAVNYLDGARAGKIEVGMVVAKLEVGSQKPEEGATQEQTPRMKVYFVKDNGMGIPAAYMPKMFTAFQRLHGNSVKGEGIGLALVRRMAERQGGQVWVESQEGVGSTFFVSLPEWNNGVRPDVPEEMRKDS